MLGITVHDSGDSDANPRLFPAAPSNGMLPSAAPKSRILGLYTRELISRSCNSDLFRLSAIIRKARVTAGLKSALVSSDRH
jgi:hypothetical protein